MTPFAKMKMAFYGFLAIVIVVCNACATTTKSVPRDARCGDFDLDVKKVWNAEIRASVQYAFVKYGGEIGGQSENEIVTQMDNLTRDWVMMREAACRDHFDRKVISSDTYTRRTACLDRHLAVSRSAIATLQAGSPDAGAQIAQAAQMASECR
ncbi:MAG: hypothetical protein IT350_07520 [Deltaproteobacteria bacterium]|nr:hypothetical protein [Deltaproteobacteria bacterium]